jgi:hypothetical protein
MLDFFHCKLIWNTTLGFIINDDKYFLNHLFCVLFVLQIPVVERIYFVIIEFVAFIKNCCISLDELRINWC